MSYDKYKDKVVIPENYLDEAYADYLGDLDKQTQNRISHHMIEKSNYDNVELARSKILQDLKINSGKITLKKWFLLLVKTSPLKMRWEIWGSHLGDAFPEEFENAIQTMNVNDISEIIELEDTFHILKLTEVIKAEIKPKSQVEKELLNELIDAEAFALLQDDFLELESKVLDGVNLYELSNLIESNLEITGLQTSDNLQIKNFPDLAPSELFNSEIIPNKIEIFEGENSYAFIMLTDSVQPQFSLLMKLRILLCWRPKQKKQISF